MQLLFGIEDKENGVILNASMTLRSTTDPQTVTLGLLEFLLQANCDLSVRAFSHPNCIQWICQPLVPTWANKSFWVDVCCSSVQVELTSVGMYDAKISRVTVHFLCCANYPQFVKTAGAACEENSQL